MHQQSIRHYFRKRSGSPLGDLSYSPKRIKLDPKVRNVKATRGPKRKIKRYGKSGSMHTLHGTIYQLKLLMLFFKRALDMKEKYKKYEFDLATELDKADKLDDIVFLYRSEKDKVRFVQAKHKQDETKQISTRDLLARNASGNDFSLQKYFTSFRKIKENSVFNGYEIEDLILYTNIDFNYSDLEKAEIGYANIEERDEILHVDVNTSKKTAVRYKLIIGEEHELYEILIRTSDLYLLAESLMDHLNKKLPIRLSDDIWKRFHVPLRKAIFTIEKEKEIIKEKETIKVKVTMRKKGSIKTNKKSKRNMCLKFCDDFVENRNLPENVSNFRKVLKSVFDKKVDDTDFKMKLRGSKLSVPSNFGEELKVRGKPLITNPYKLAQEIARNSSKAKEEVVTIQRSYNIVKNNIDKLAGHVLVLDDDGSSIRFRKVFFDDNHELAGNLKELKKALKAELAKKGIDFNKLREYRYRITNYNTCKETSEGELLPNHELELPSDTVKKETVKEFFEKLVFAVNQPSEDELGDLISEELGESVQFNLLNHTLLGDTYQRQILDWFKEKGDTKGKEGRFLNYEDAVNLFNIIEQKVNSLICVALSLPVRGDLQKRGIKFDKNDIFDYLETFLRAANTSQKVLHLVTPKKTILIEMKVYSALEKFKQLDARYKKQDSYIFMKLKHLLQPSMQKIALEAFKAAGSHHLLIVTCDYTKEEMEIKKLCDKLNKILLDTNKPVILIAEEDNTLVQTFPDNQVIHFRSTTTFDHLTDKSKEKLLMKEVSFQGKKNSFKMMQLFSKLDDKNLLSTEQLNIIDGEALVELVSSKIIRIGRKLLGRSDLEGAYIKLYEPIDKNVLVDILQESVNSKEYFLISGIEGTDKEAFIENLKSNEDQICELTLKNDRVPIQGIKKVTYTDSKFEKHHFKQLCDHNPSEKFYWIEWKDNKFILHSLYNPRFIERQFKYPNKIDFSDDIKIELLSSSEDNIFFVTGLDKPENLFEVLQLKFKNEQERLSENFKSGKIIVQTSSCTNESEFNNLASQKDKENKCVYWLDISKEDSKKQIIWRDVTRKPASEAEFIRTIEGKSSIIIDKPGMGKSTTLAILSEKMLATHWVIFITLRDWQETLNNLPEKIDNDVVIDFLTATKNLNTSLEKNLAKFLLDKEREGGLKPLLLMLDGFDEIRSYDAENVAKKNAEELLRFLKENTRCTVWITAREQDAIKLQNILSMFCLKFEPLQKDEHYGYFKNFWRNSLKLTVSKDEFNTIFSGDNNKFETYYDALSKAADAIFANKNNDFMGIPLTLRLFAEGFQDKFKEFVCSDEYNENFVKDFDNLSILNLYKYFVDQKFLIFIWEKTNLSAGFTKTSEGWFREKLIKLHCRLAFKELFGRDETKELLGLKKPFEGEEGHVDSEQLAELLNVGIIRSIKAEHYEFLHRTIAEYFTSRLLIYILRNKEHNNLAKYKRTLKFLQNNILKQSNEIIRNFLNAGMQDDKKLHDILQPILTDVDYKNLLGRIKSKYTFTIDARRYKEAGDLEEITRKIKSCLTLVDRSYSIDLKPAEFQSIISDELKPSFMYETDVEKLKDSLKYLMEIYGKVSVNKINLFLRDNITDFISHYILQAEEQSKLDKDLLEIWIRNIHMKSLRLNPKDPNWNIAKERKTVNCSKNDVIDSIFTSGILTIQIADFIISQFSKPTENRNTFFYSLISPLLSFKYYCSKYSFIYVNGISSVALLNLFQSFASDSTRNTSLNLSRASLEGILLCIQETLNPVKFSKDSFIVSVKALIALGYWGFQLSYTNNALNLCHSQGYSSELNLKYEEYIIELLRFRSNNPETNFDEKLAGIPNNLSTTTPASI